MRVVEMVGPAGVGKTTLSAELAAAYPDAVRLTAYRPSSLAAYLRAPDELLRALKFLLRAGGVRLLLKKTAINWIFVLGALLHGRMLARRRRVVVIYDQLVIQALRRIARETGKSVSELVRASEEPIRAADVIVSAWAPLEVVRERRAKRGDSEKALADLGSATEFRLAWIDTRRAVRILTATNRQQLRVLHLDGRASVTENRHRLLQFARSLDPAIRGCQ